MCLPVVSLLAAATMVAGCGDRATSHQAAATTSGTPTRTPMTVVNRADHTVPLRALLQATIPAPNGSWLASYDGSIWVKRDDGYVIRVDPRTNKQTGRVGSFTGQDSYCQGIGAGGGAIWSCQHGSITRIDPRTVKIVAKIPIGKAFDQGRYVFADRRIWLITGPQGDRLTGIDTATNQPGPAIVLPYGCGDLAPGGDVVWVLCPVSGHVVKVDVANRRVIGTIAIPSTYNGYATSTDLWVGSNADLIRVDAATLRTTAVFKNAGPGQGGDVTVDGDNVWVSTSNGELYKIDAKSNTVVDHVTAPPRLGGGGSLISAAGSLWSTAGTGSTGPLRRIRPGRAKHRS
jgi:hypothetical protein